MATPADSLAAQRADITGGRDAALSKLRRRFISLPVIAAPMVLVKALKLPVAPPAAFREWGEPSLDNRRLAMRG